MKIAIIDYDAGNLANVVRAATRAGLDVVVTRDPEEIREAKALILPGVGAMKDAMEHLSGYGLTDIIREEVRKGKKLAGIARDIKHAPRPLGDRCVVVLAEGFEFDEQCGK